MLVLETLEHARERGARIYAEIAGFGLSSDAHHYAAPHPEGSGLALAISRAMDTAQLTPEEVQYINLHATSTRSGDIAETRAIKEVFQGYAHELALSSTKSMTGHMLGAAGAAETIVTILAMNHDVAPPTINLEQPDEECDLDYTAGVAAEQPISVGLSNAAGFGGHNAVVALQAFD